MTVEALDNTILKERSIKKQRVAANFTRAAATYDSAANLQHRVARHTMQGLPVEVWPGQVLDLGSGTGSQAPELEARYPRCQVTGLDMAMGMLRHARATNQGKQLSWCSGDIEALPFQAGSLDLVFSSLAIQWCRLEKVLQQVELVLKPGGRFVFSTLAAGTMVELRNAWAKVDRHVHVNGFESFEVQQERVHQSSFQVESFQQRIETLHYVSVKELLKELKALGVNTVHGRNQGLMSRGRLSKLQQAYELFRQDQGLPLSYRVIYGVLCKPPG